MAFHHFQKLAESVAASVLSDPDLAGLHPLVRQAQARFQAEQNYPALHAIITLLRRDGIKTAAHEIAHEGPARSVHGAYLSARSFLLACLNAEPFTHAEWRGIMEDKGLVWTGLRYVVLPAGLSCVDCDLRGIPEGLLGLADQAITLVSEDRPSIRNRQMVVEPGVFFYMLWHMRAPSKQKDLQANDLSLRHGERHEDLMESARIKLIRLGRATQTELPAELFKAREEEKIAVRPHPQPIKSSKRRSFPKARTKPKAVVAVGDFLDQYRLLSNH